MAELSAIAQITPAQRMAPAGQHPPGQPASSAANSTSGAKSKLTRRQKAAIVVRFLISEGAPLELAHLPPHHQDSLTRQMGAMRSIDRATLAEVIQEFAGDLEQFGLSFPRGLMAALQDMDDKLAPEAAEKLRLDAGLQKATDPWEKIRALEPASLLEIINREAPEVSAVLLSKLDTRKAANLLSQLPGDQARALTLSISRTAGIRADAVARIGAALAEQLQDTPDTAFTETPSRRVGAMLNMSPAATRDALLQQIEAADAHFAAEVRQSILTFADLRQRLPENAVARVLREVDQPTLVVALQYGVQTGGATLTAPNSCWRASRAAWPRLCAKKWPNVALSQIPTAKRRKMPSSRPPGNWKRGATLPCTPPNWPSPKPGQAI